MSEKQLGPEDFGRQRKRARTITTPTNSATISKTASNNEQKLEQQQQGKNKSGSGDANDEDDEEMKLLQQLGFPDDKPKTTDDDDDDDDDMNFLFTSRKLREEQELEQQRKLRRERLARKMMEKEKEEKSNYNESMPYIPESTTVEKGKDSSDSKTGNGDSDPSLDPKNTSANDEQKMNVAKSDVVDEDDFDMFSSSVSSLSPDGGAGGTVQNHKTMSALTSKEGKNSTNPNRSNDRRGHEQQTDWDDAEGYYKAVIGENIELKNVTTSSAQEQNQNPFVMNSANGNNNSSGGMINFKVAGVVGKGVFSTVLKCSTISNTTSVELPPVIAVKCVRHNDTMAKAALQEIKLLQQLKGCRGIVQLLLPLCSEREGERTPTTEYRGHVLLAFPFFEYNLRDVLIKFGKGVGLSLQAVQSYFGQLLAAATHLKKHGIIHADLKPDNILVSGDYATVQLADFGSAFEATTENQSQASTTPTTPYLVSRYYRAPEIILGLPPTIAVDLWSLSVTVAEVFLGDVVFRGKSNNDMLYVFMQHLGPFSNRMIRQHLVQHAKMPQVIPRQFVKQEGTAFMFTQKTTDQVSGENVFKILPLVSNHNAMAGGTSNPQKFPWGTPLNLKIVKAKSPKDSKASVFEFSDLLQKCLVLDPSKRLALKDALQHKFFHTSPSASH